MEREKIRELLDKYYEGETSAEEETELLKLLSDPAASASFPEEKYLPLCRTEIPEPSPDFFSRLEAVTSSRKMTPSRLRPIRYSVAIAAGLALLIGSAVLFDYLTPHRMHDTYSDPDLAMAEVRSILTMVSDNMKTGTEALGPMKSIGIAPAKISEFSRINKTVERDLGNLRYLNRLNPESKTTNND